MVFWNGQRFESGAPTLIPDIRIHVENWRQFRKVSGAWPALSIKGYATRFAIMIGGVITVLVYAGRHDWTKGRGFMVCLAVLLPVLFGWFIVERAAWNRDLQRKGISSDTEVWSVTQFPQA